jgi:hypothetical protein
MRNAARKVIAPSNRSVGRVLRVWVVVLDAAAPRYTCSGWGGPADGRGGEKGRDFRAEVEE